MPSVINKGTDHIFPNNVIRWVSIIAGFDKNFFKNRIFFLLRDLAMMLGRELLKLAKIWHLYVREYIYTNTHVLQYMMIRSLILYFSIFSFLT